MVVDMNELFDKGELLSRDVKLSGVERERDRWQFTITIPSDFVKVCGWQKGEILKAELILGSGLVCLSKREG